MENDVPDINLEALDAYLMSDASPEDSMLLSDLDGFLTGIAVGPGLIPPSEWMPVIWAGQEPEFGSTEQMQTIIGTIMGRYNEIVATMSSDPYGLDPIFYEGGPDGTLIVTDWAGGFLDAINLRSEAWDPLFKHRRAKILLVPLFILGDDEDFFEKHPSPHEKEFYASAPDVLETCVAGIFDFWQEYRPPRRKQSPRRPRGGRRKTT